MSKCWKSAFHHGSLKRPLLPRTCEDEDLCETTDVSMGSRLLTLPSSADKPALPNYKALYNLITSTRHEFSETVCEIFVKLLSWAYILEKRILKLCSKMSEESSSSVIKQQRKVVFLFMEISYCPQFQFLSNIRNDNWKHYYSRKQ